MLVSEAALARLTASVNRTRLSEADVLKLVLKIEGQTVSGQPDMTALTRDFEILRMNGPSTETRISITNGRRVNESSTTWEILLRPKHLGTINIPQFSYGNEATNPIVITVVPQTAEMKRQANQFVALETSVNTTETYVQAELIYKVKLLYVENISGNFPVAPVFENAIVETLEDERRYDTVVNNQRYYVLEKSYAIYPQRSGTLSIPRESFTGLRSGNSFFAARQQVNALSDSHEIEVKAKPEAFTSDDWLPATALVLSESYVDGTQNFTVGEPINRTLTITVDGLAASLIPPFSNIEIEGAKTYKDPAIESQEISPEGLRSTKSVTIGIVPTKAGLMTIPEIRIPWWNTLSDTLEVATIPAQSFEVTGTSLKETIQTSPDIFEPTQESPGKSVQQTEQSPFWKVIALAMTLLSLVTTYLWLRKPGLTSAEPKEKPQTVEDDNAILKALIISCKNNEKDVVLSQFYRWGKLRYPSIESIAALLKLIDNEQITEEVQSLEAALYAGDTENQDRQSWQGQTLAELLKNLSQTKDGKGKTTALASELNPL